jgi:tetrahydromethanopterin S-methyltransferase subunit G
MVRRAGILVAAHVTAEKAASPSFLGSERSQEICQRNGRRVARQVESAPPAALRDHDSVAAQLVQHFGKIVGRHVGNFGQVAGPYGAVLISPGEMDSGAQRIFFRLRDHEGTARAFNIISSY